MIPPWWHRLLASIPESPLLPETVFLAVGAVAGLLFVLATPAFEGADEPAHWRRAYQVSEGVILAERRGDQVGGFLPASVKARRGPLRPNERAFVDFRNSAVYPPIPYLTHALAIRLGAPSSRLRSSCSTPPGWQAWQPLWASAFSPSASRRSRSECSCCSP